MSQTFPRKRLRHGWEKKTLYPTPSGEKERERERETDRERERDGTVLASPVSGTDSRELSGAWGACGACGDV